MKRFIAVCVLLLAAVVHAAPVDPVGKDTAGRIVPATRVLTSLLSGPLTCDVASSALPAGAATEATLMSVDTRQSTANGYLSTIATNQCTAAGQTTGNASLASIDAKLSSQATAAKQDTQTGHLSTIAAAQDVAASTRASAALQTTGNASLASIDATLTAVNAKLASLGQKTMAGSVPVVIASDQSALSVIGGRTPADAMANPTTLVGTQAFLMGWNPNINAWDRVFAEGIQSDNDNGPTSGLLSAENYPMIFDGTTWDRWRASSSTSGSARVLPHDGTNGVSITAASTAAAAADPALVVALSPNSPPPKEADTTCSATLTNGSPTLTCSTLQGVGALGFYLAYGAGGSIATQATYDGTNYFSVSACPPSAPSSGCVSSLSATGQYVIPLAGYSAVRFSGSGLSGSHTLTARATAKTGWVQPTGVTTVAASSLPLPTGAANAVAQGSTTSGQTGELVQAAVTTNAPTYTTGQTSPLSLGTSGGLRTQQIGDSFIWLSAAGSYGIRSGAGILRRVIVGSNVAGGINCYDNTAGSGTVIVSLTTTISTPFNYVEVGAAFSTGLYCVTTGTGQSLTVVYAPAT